MNELLAQVKQHEIDESRDLPLKLKRLIPLIEWANEHNLICQLATRTESGAGYYRTFPVVSIHSAEGSGDYGSYTDKESFLDMAHKYGWREPF